MYESALRKALDTAMHAQELYHRLADAVLRPKDETADSEPKRLQKPRKSCVPTSGFEPLLNSGYDQLARPQDETGGFAQGNFASATPALDQYRESLKKRMQEERVNLRLDVDAVRVAGCCPVGGRNDGCEGFRTARSKSVSGPSGCATARSSTYLLMSAKPYIGRPHCSSGNMPTTLQKGWLWEESRRL